jgi:hypothetical protein
MSVRKWIYVEMVHHIFRCPVGNVGHGQLWIRGNEGDLIGPLAQDREGICGTLLARHMRERLASCRSKRSALCDVLSSYQKGGVQ